MRKLYLILIIAFMLQLAVVGSAGQIEDILAEADSWIISDTARIMSYVDSCTKVVEQKLDNSPFWADTHRDLSFLLGIDYTGSAQIDNTGRIYFTMRITGETGHLFYIDGPMGWPKQLSPNNWPAEGYSIWGYEPHPSGDYVLVLAMKYGSERHDIWKFDRDGTFEPLLVNPNVRYSNTIFKSKDEFFLSIDDQQNQYFCKYTISTGKLDTLYQDDEWAGIYDYEDGKLLCGRFFSFSESQLFLLDEESLETKNMTKKGSYGDAYFTGDGRIILTTDKKSKRNEFNKLVYIKTDKPKRLKVIFDPKMENSGFEYIKSSKMVIMTLNKDGYSELVGFDLDGNPVDVPKIPVGVLAGGGPYDENGATNDNGDFVYGFSSPNVAPSLYHFKLGENKITQLATVSTFGFDFSKVKVEVIRYPSLDGTMIPALLYTPINVNKDGSNPALVDYHGGPPQQWRPYFQRNLAFALAKGFIVVRPNVRGSEGYGPEWEKADNQKKRFDALGDAEAALDYLVNEGYSSYDKIGIWGGSYGGYTVNWLATTAPDKFACAISQVGVADHDYTQTHGDVGGQKIWEEEFGKVGSKLAHNLSPIWKSENLSKPILLTAGFYDPRVFPGDPRRFGYLLSKLGKEVYYLESVETGHGAVTKDQIITEYTRYYTFFMEHLMK
ncbi:MAG: S9 family peptidase [candidate division Zixibacteria bacterium]|nr:S9 family peptidase [candidate division Zixibacteria bacterium]